jgi:putative hemolysin
VGNGAAEVNGAAVGNGRAAGENDAACVCAHDVITGVDGVAWARVAPRLRSTFRMLANSSRRSASRDVDATGCACCACSACSSWLGRVAEAGG